VSKPALISGLDLGMVSDHSALCTLERTPRVRAEGDPVPRRKFRYALRWLETWDLGTRYTAVAEGERSICGDVKARFDSPALRWSPLAVDFTGVGTAVVDQLRAAKVAARLNPVLITSGHQVMRREETKERAWHVPKKELVSTLVALLQSGLVTWPRVAGKKKLTDFERTVKKLEGELSDFRLKVTKSANETFGADKSQHDDLVLSLMLAAWLGENTGSGDVSGVSVAPADEGVLGGAPDGVFASGKAV
jgi:hypothetical protein